MPSPANAADSEHHAPTYLLAKHPARLQTFELAFGKAHVFYPEATDERCTAALLLDIDPVGLSRGRKGAGGPPLEPYVNDRPYVASSFLSVAIAQVFGSALAGRSKERPELVATPIPLVASLPALPCRGGESFLRGLFEPLGYTVQAKEHPLDPAFAEWGRSPYFSITLEGRLRLSELLGHLYVLVPVLDDQKHYWVGQDELESCFGMAKAGSPGTRLAKRLRRDTCATSEALRVKRSPGSRWRSRIPRPPKQLAMRRKHSSKRRCG